MTLKEAADIVVRYLDPFYTQGKFATKVRYFGQLCHVTCGNRVADGFFHRLFGWVQELFKAFARYLSHLLVEGRSQGKGQGKADRV